MTDNEAVKHYQFYDPQNIFLLQERALDELPDFLATPYHSVDATLLEFLMHKYGPNVFTARSGDIPTV